MTLIPAGIESVCITINLKQKLNLIIERHNHNALCRISEQISGPLTCNRHSTDTLQWRISNRTTNLQISQAIGTRCTGAFVDHQEADIAVQTYIRLVMSSIDRQLQVLSSYYMEYLDGKFEHVHVWVPLRGVSILHTFTN